MIVNSYFTIQLNIYYHYAEFFLLIPGPYVSIWELGTLLKGTSAVLWRCPVASSYDENTFYSWSA